MASFNLDDVRDQLINIVATMYREQGGTGEIYKAEQWLKAIQRVLQSNSSSHLSFTTPNDCIRALSARMNVYYNDLYIKQAIRNARNRQYRNNNMSNNNNNRQRQYRQRNRQRNRQTNRRYNSAPTVPITISNVFQVSEQKMKYFLTILSIMHTTSLITNKTFKFYYIFNLIALVHQINVEDKIKKKIKKILIDINAIGDIGYGKCIIYDRFISILASIPMDNDEKNKIKDMLLTKSKSAKNRNRNDNIDNVTETKENSTDLQIYNSNENTISLSTNKIYFTEIQWEILFRENPELYSQRKHTYNELLEYFFAEKYGADIVFFPERGNCMPLGILHHEHNGNDFFVTTDYVELLRKSLCDYIKLNRQNYEITDNELLICAQNGKLLDERHLQAYHKMEKTNIVIFEYEEKYGNDSQKIYYNSDYEDNPTMYLVFEELKSGVGHYNTIKMGANKYFLPIDKLDMNKTTVQFIKAEPNNDSNELNMLQIFDQENNIKDIITPNTTDRNTIINVFGSILFEQISFLGDSTLIRGINELHWTSTTFKNKSVNIAINEIMDALLDN